MAVKLRKGTNRNTPAHVVTIGKYSLYFSYETCIAVYSPYGGFRIQNYWGPTTGRHFNEMGVAGFNLVEDRDVFDDAVDAIGTKYATRKMQALARKYNPCYQEKIA